MPKLSEMIQEVEGVTPANMNSDELISAFLRFPEIKSQDAAFWRAKEREFLTQILEEQALRDALLGWSFAGSLKDTDNMLRGYGINPEDFTGENRKTVWQRLGFDETFVKNLNEMFSVLYSVLLEVDPRAQRLANAIYEEHNVDHP